MKNSKSIFLKLSGTLLSVSIIFYSCGPSAEGMYNHEAKSKTFSDSLSKAIQAIKEPALITDTNRTFVRTADLSFMVKDVKSTTYDIERIVSENKGYVTSSILESNINYKNSVRISKDTMLDVITYSIHNNIIIRIPNTELDKALAKISTLIDYLDYRKIKAEDVTIQFQSAKLSESRFVTHKKRLEKAVDGKGKKLNQIVEAENELVNKQELADDSKLNTMELAHDVSYSTVFINIYQKETTRKEAYAYSLPSEPYTPNYGSKFTTSLSDGAFVFGEVILFFIKLWPIAVLAVSLIILIKFFLKQKWFA